MYNQEIPETVFSTDIIRVIKSSKSMWRGWGSGRVHTGFWWGYPRKKNTWKTLAYMGG
jgi:hypothetical protein